MNLKNFFIVLLSIVLISISPNLAFAKENVEIITNEKTEQELETTINEDLGEPTTGEENESTEPQGEDNLDTEPTPTAETITPNNVVEQNQVPNSLNTPLQLDEKIVFKLNDRSNEVKTMKYNLMKLGFGTHWKNPTTFYGNDTVKVVKEFQVYYKTKANPDGLMDEVTYKRLNDELKSEFQKGKRSENIKQLKHDLMLIGFGTHWKNPSTLYGNDTVKVVKQFQQANKLVVSGIVDSITLEKIQSQVKSVKDKGFSKGMKGTEIQKLKRNLVKAGFGTHWKNPSTYFGQDTEKVVRHFQDYYNINPKTGALDPQTISKLQQVISSTYQKGKRSEDIKTLKLNLIKVGFGTHWKNPTTLYGSDTEKVVKEFQKANRLVVNGIFDEVTEERLNNLLTRNFSKGMTSKQIREFKLNLVKAGFGTHWKNPSTYYGPDTEKVVKQFQTYYKLKKSDGVTNQETLNKLNEVLNSPYQKGKRSEDIKTLKLNLIKVGFGTHWKNPTTLYGSDTEKVVKEFQKAYKLVVNGIVDEVTMKKINDLLNSGYALGMKSQQIKNMKLDLIKAGFGTHWGNNPTDTFDADTEKVVKEFQAYYSLPVDGEMHIGSLNKLKQVLSSPYQYGKSSNQIKKLKEDLWVIGFGRHWKNPTTFYGRDTEKVVKEFQEAYDLVVNGIIDEVTLAKINDLMKTTRNTYYDITLGKAVELQMNTNPQTDEKYAYVHKNHIKNNTVTASVLNVRKGPGTNFDILGTLKRGTSVKIVGELGDFYAIEYSHSNLVSAIKSRTTYYLNPLHFTNDKVQRFQFLDLSRLSGATETQLNNFLKDKGVLENQGKWFIEAGRIHRVNEVYLVSHSILETGHGTSQLARGVKVGLDKDGVPQVVTTKNEKSLTNIKTVYNLFGINANDNCPLECGARRAYNEDWTSISKAITGGAKFIGNGYIEAGQNTLYKMKWNPQGMVDKGIATHQYATDIRWASKQVGNIYTLYEQIGIKTYFFDIPVYK